MGNREGKALAGQQAFKWEIIAAGSLPCAKGRSMDYALGIDLGTSGVKAGLLNLSTLKMEFVSIKEYDALPEQDAEILWSRSVEAIREATAWLEGRGRILVVGLSGQMHGAVLYNAQGELIAPVITWKDRKWSSPANIEKMYIVLGKRSYAELGCEISSGYSAAILFGIRENAPQLFTHIAHFHLPVDFLRSKLLESNSYATDPTNAFGTGLFDTKNSCWHAEIIRGLQLPKGILPEIHETTQVAGQISTGVAHLTGLQAGLPVIYGGGDNPVSMLGSGLSGPGSPVLINIGTGAQVSKVSAQFRRFPGLDTRSFFEGNFAIVGASLAGGESYTWLQSEIKKTEGIEISYRDLDSLAAHIPVGAGGLIFCPGPTRQALSRPKGFFGAVAKVEDKAYRARAVLEGIIMDLYKGYQILERDDRLGFILGAGGGLQRSPVWAQIAADLLGKPLRITAFDNAVFGATLLAAKGIQSVDRLDQAVKSIKVAAEMIPDPVKVRHYREEFIPYWREVVSDVR